MEGKKGGTWEAAKEVNEYIKRTLHNLSEEELHALRTLAAFAVQQEDAVPRMWHCDTDCRNENHRECQGQYSLDMEKQELCPYFSDMLF